jgi:SAM-dependent methyltransferase
MSMKNSIATFVRDKLQLVLLIRFFNRQIRGFSRFTHKLQFFIEWRVSNPEYFEHQMDLNYQWHETRSAFPMERGVFSSFALKNDMPPSGRTLDLCCGDGFYSYYFYSKRSKSVIGIDFDPKAIKFAQKNYGAASNIQFIIGDIRTSIPDGPFENIIWDAAIEHFTEIEIKTLMSRIKSVLSQNGVLSGYTIVEPEHGGKHLHQHEYEFHNKEDLARFLSPHFRNLQVFSTSYPDRTNLYFYASDGLLPFEQSNSIIVR